LNIHGTVALNMSATEQENDQCCTLPPFTSDYEPIGKKVTIKVEGKDDMEVYITGPSSPSTSRKALVAIYGDSAVSGTLPSVALFDVNWN
jgi:hypothetical protein